MPTLQSAPMSEDAKTLIDKAVRTFLDEVPALER